MKFRILRKKEGKRIIKGRILKKLIYPIFIDNLYPKLPIIFNNVCPAIIFAKSRTDTEITRKVYEINSIRTKIKDSRPSTSKNENVAQWLE